MPPSTPTLQLMCGKGAAGKSPLCAKLGQDDYTVTHTEDDS